MVYQAINIDWAKRIFYFCLHKKISELNMIMPENGIVQLNKNHSVQILKIGVVKHFPTW